MDWRRTFFVHSTNGLGQRRFIHSEILDVKIDFASLRDNLSLCPNMSEAVVEGMLCHV